MPKPPRRWPRKAKSDGKILVVLELSGGNDGLNTLVPYGDDAYYKQRPNLGIPPKELRPIDDHFGFSGGMAGFERLYKERQAGHRARLRIRESFVLAFHFDGVLAYGGAEQRRRVWLGGPSGGCDGARRSAEFPGEHRRPGNRWRFAAGKHVPVVFDDPNRFSQENFAEETRSCYRMIQTAVR